MSAVWLSIPNKWASYSYWIFQTTREGAQTTIFCAVSQALLQANGKYYSECHVRSYHSDLSYKFELLGWKCVDSWFQEAKLSESIQNELLAKKYWEMCENLVQLKKDDPHIVEP